jgi:hypothetical protein
LKCDFDYCVNNQLTEEVGNLPIRISIVDWIIANIAVKIEVSAGKTDRIRLKKSPNARIIDSRLVIMKPDFLKPQLSRILVASNVGSRRISILVIGVDCNNISARSTDRND